MRWTSLWLSLITLAFIARMVSGEQIGLVLSTDPNVQQPVTLFKINVDSTVGSEFVSGQQPTTLGNSVVAVTSGNWLCALKNDGVVVCDPSFGVQPPLGLLFGSVVSTVQAESDTFADNCVAGLQRNTGLMFVWGGDCFFIKPPSPPISFAKITLGYNFFCGILNGTAPTAIANRVKDVGIVRCYGASPPRRPPDPSPTTVFVDFSCGGAATAVCCGITLQASVQCFAGQINTYAPNPPSDSRYVAIQCGITLCCVIDFKGVLSCFGLFMFGNARRPQTAAIPPPFTGSYAQLTIFESAVVSPDLSRVCGLSVDGTITCAGNVGSTPGFLQLKSLSVGRLSACGLTLQNAPLCFSDPTLNSNPAPPIALTHSHPFYKIDSGYDHSCGIMISNTTVAATASSTISDTINTAVGGGEVVCWNSTAAWRPLLASGRKDWTELNGDCGLYGSDRSLGCWFPGSQVYPGSAHPMKCRLFSSFHYDFCCVTPPPDSQLICWSQVMGPAFITLLPSPQAASLTIIEVAEGGYLYAIDGDNSTIFQWPSLRTGVSAGIVVAGANVTDFCANAESFCWLDSQSDGMMECEGYLSAYTPCHMSGWKQLTCQRKIACTLNGLGQPSCFDGPPTFDGTPNGYSAFLPLQEPVNSLAGTGFYYSPRTGQPEVCSSGTYSLNPGAVTPLCSGQCAAGEYNAAGKTSNSTICDSLCPAGSYCNQGTPAPVPCPPGVFGSSTGLTSSACTLPCPQGFYCLSGTVNPTQTPCPPGTFGAAAGLDSADDCSLCPPSTFSSTYGNLLCTTCSVGSYTVEYGAQSCQSCESISGVLCNGGKVINGDNYWTYIVNDTITGQSEVMSVQCPPRYCVADGLCGSGRLPFATNPLCGACDQSAGFSALGDSCINCTAPNGGFMTLLLVISVGYVFIMYHASQGDGASDMKIFLYFISTSSLFLGPDMGRWLGWLGLINFDPLRSAFRFCILPMDAYMNMASSFVVPLLFLTELVLFGVLHWGIERCSVRWCRNGKPWKLRYNFRVEGYATAFMSLLIGSYSTIADNCFQYLNCVTVNDGHSVMFTAPAIDCHSQRYKYVLIPIAGLIVFPVIGLPFIALPLIMWRGRHAPDHTAAPNASPVAKAVAMWILSSYRDRFFWWEAFAIVRRSTFVALSNILYPFPVQRSQAFCITCMVIFLAHTHAKPFRMEMENQMESLSLLLLLILAVLMTGQETHLTETNAVLATLLVTVPIVAFVGMKVYITYQIRRNGDRDGGGVRWWQKRADGGGRGGEPLLSDVAGDASDLNPADVERAKAVAALDTAGAISDHHPYHSGGGGSNHHSYLPPSSSSAVLQSPADAVRIPLPRMDGGRETPEAMLGLPPPISASVAGAMLESQASSTSTASEDAKIEMPPPSLPALAAAPSSPIAASTNLVLAPPHTPPAAAAAVKKPSLNESTPLLSGAINNTNNKLVQY